jgi:FKBP-type peptidyl-prolyl cis-trans isomerase
MNGRKAIFLLLLVLVLMSVVVEAKKSKKSHKSHAGSKTHKKRANLPHNSELKVAVKHRPKHCDKKSQDGDRLSMQYTGRLYTNGKKFDSSYDRHTPFSFTLGEGRVIDGWEEGLKDMCVGEKRRLTIPSDKGYGAAGSPPNIPGGATLVFDVELVKIQKEGEMDISPPF